jgi:hypothetical protein
MRRISWGLAGGLAALALGGCMTSAMGTGIVQLSPDSYRLSRVDGVGRFADTAAMKAALLEEASAFAKGQGKVAVPTASHEEAMRAGHLLTAELEFRLVAPGDAAAVPAAPPTAPVARTSPAAPVATAQPLPATAVLPAPTASPPPAPLAPAMAPPALPDVKPSLYNELIMLDDLRKRGILTDAEFQALKTKLLAGK